MELSSVLGITGSIIIVIGAIYPIKQTKVPVKSVKNRLFAFGSLVLLLYAIAGYLNGGNIFFIYLELLITIACILMMINTDDRRDTGIIGGLGIVLLIWSRFLFHSRSMALFTVAFIILGLGYAFDMHTVRRYATLTLGGALIALSSYLDIINMDASRIFFGLNIFFALFSLYYTLRLNRIQNRHKK